MASPSMVEAANREAHQGRGHISSEGGTIESGGVCGNIFTNCIGNLSPLTQGVQILHFFQEKLQTWIFIGKC